MALNERQVAELAFNGRRERYVDQPGLYLTVGRRTKVWEFKRRNRWIRIGEWPSWSCSAARIRANELTVEADRGNPLGLTLDVALQKWKARPIKRSPLSILHMTQATRKHFGDWLNRDLAKLTREDLVRRHDKIAREAGPGAAKNAMITFRAIWNQAMRLDPLLPVCPTVAVDVAPGRKRDGSDLLNRLAEFRTGLELISPVRKALYLMALFTGMRRTTLLELRWEDVGADSLTVRSPKRARGVDPVAYTIPLTPDHFKILEAVRGLHEHLVFKGLSDANLIRTERRLWKARGLPPFSPHLLRHCFISAGVEAGVQPYALSMLANHRIAGITGTYVANLIDTRPAMEAIISRLTQRMAAS